MKHSSNEEAYLRQAPTEVSNDDIQRLQYQVYQCNYLLKAQQQQLNGYKDLVEELYNTKKELLQAEKEVSELKQMIKQERQENVQETRLLSRKIEMLSRQQEVPSNCSSSLLPVSPLEKRVNPISHDKHNPCSVEKCMLQYKNLIDDFLEVKLELARSQSEVDYKNLELNRIQEERDTLLDILYIEQNACTQFKTHGKTNTNLHSKPSVEQTRILRTSSPENQSISSLIRSVVCLLPNKATMVTTKISRTGYQSRSL